MIIKLDISYPEKQHTVWNYRNANPFLQQAVLYRQFLPQTKKTEHLRFYWLIAWDLLWQWFFLFFSKQLSNHSAISKYEYKIKWNAYTLCLIVSIVWQPLSVLATLHITVWPTEKSDMLTFSPSSDISLSGILHVLSPILVLTINPSVGSIFTIVPVSNSVSVKKPRKKGNEIHWVHWWLM